MATLLSRAGQDNDAIVEILDAAYKHPLHSLASLGACEPLRVLCESQSHDIDELSIHWECSHTALYCAVQKKQPAAAEILILHMADVNHEGGQRANATPLQWACEEGDEPTVRLLLQHGADPNKAHPRLPDRWPLTLATERDNYRLVSLLIEARADPDAESAEKWDFDANDVERGTALWLASHKGLIRTARELLKAGVCPDRLTSTTAGGKSALFEAIGCGYSGLAMLLVDAHADVCLADVHVAVNGPGIAPIYRGFSPLYLGSGANGNGGANGSSAYLVNALLQRSADVNQRTANGATPFLIACQEGLLEIARRLSCEGAVRESTCSAVECRDKEDWEDWDKEEESAKHRGECEAPKATDGDGGRAIESKVVTASTLASDNGHGPEPHTVL